MVNFLNYINDLKLSPQVVSTLVHMKSQKDINIVIGVTSREYIIPVRASIEAQIYTKKDLNIQHIRLDNKSNILKLLTTNGETIHIEIVEEQEAEEKLSSEKEGLFSKFLKAGKKQKAKQSPADATAVDNSTTRD